MNYHPDDDLVKCNMFVFDTNKSIHELDRVRENLRKCSDKHLLKHAQDMRELYGGGYLNV